MTRRAVLRRPIAALILVGLLVGCGARADADVVRGSAARRAAEPASALPVASALDRFGGELFTAVAEVSTDNVILSPYSVAVALAMTRAGAAGETRAQLDRTLHFEGIDVDAGFNALERALSSRSKAVENAEGERVDVKLATANALWPQKGYPFTPMFLDLLAAQYGAGLHVVDFEHNTEAARRAINKWVAAETAKKIPELIPKDALDTLTRLVLTNAIYLKAAWAEPFDEAATSDRSFRRLDATTVSAPFMHLTTELRFASGSGWQTVELPYAGGQLAMDLIVPDSGRFDEVATTLRHGATPFLSGLSRQTVDLSLPKFRFRTAADIVDILASLGIVDLFDPTKADLSGMTDAEKLYVSGVLHEAFIDVNEKGTEAAAATAIVIRASAAPAKPVELVVDRPFFVVLRDLETNAVLFLGRVVDPTKTSA
jgi:serpin B